MGRRGEGELVMKIVAQQGTLEDENITVLIAVNDTEGFMYDLHAAFRWPILNLFAQLAHGNGYWESPTVSLTVNELQNIRALPEHAVEH